MMHKLKNSNQYVIIAAALSALSVSYADAATTTTALEIGGVNSGWVAQHSDDVTVTVLSVDPSTANIEIIVNGTINPGEAKESIALKQVTVDPEKKFHDEAFFWIRDLTLTNESGKDWNSFEIKAIDGSGRKINALEFDDHPDAAHIHAMTPVDEGVLLSQATNGLALPENRLPFARFSLAPYGYPCDPNCSLGVSKVTLSEGVVPKMGTFHPRNIRLHVKKHEAKIAANRQELKIYDTTMIVDFTPNP